MKTKLILTALAIATILPSCTTHKNYPTKYEYRTRYEYSSGSDNVGSTGSSDTGFDHLQGIRVTIKPQ